ARRGAQTMAAPVIDDVLAVAVFGREPIATMVTVARARAALVATLCLLGVARIVAPVLMAVALRLILVTAVIAIAFVIVAIALALGKGASAGAHDHCHDGCCNCFIVHADSLGLDAVSSRTLNRADGAGFVPVTAKHRLIHRGVPFAGELMRTIYRRARSASLGCPAEIDGPQFFRADSDRAAFCPAVEGGGDFEISRRQPRQEPGPFGFGVDQCFARPIRNGHVDAAQVFAGL